MEEKGRGEAGEVKGRREEDRRRRAGRGGAGPIEHGICTVHVFSPTCVPLSNM
jgi:hypothetical protein